MQNHKADLSLTTINSVALGVGDQESLNNNSNNNNNNKTLLKAQLVICYSLFTAMRTVCNMYTQMARGQSCAHHMQHTVRLPLQHVVCHVVRRDSPAIMFDWVEITFISSVFDYGMKGQLSYYVWQGWNHIYFIFIWLAETKNWWKRTRNQRAWRKPDELQKMPHTKAWMQAQSATWTSTGGRRWLGKQTY